MRCIIVIVCVEYKEDHLVGGGFFLLSGRVFSQLNVLLFVDQNFGQVFESLFMLRSFSADTAAGWILVLLNFGSV